MNNFVIAAREALWIVRDGSIEQHLQDQSPEAVAVDTSDPTRMYVGTWGGGLWRSTDAGRNWEPVGKEISYAEISAVAVDRMGNGSPAVVYVGTEPSTMSRSEDGGDTWQPLPALQELPSSTRWAFPPKPETHHVRWIETDPVVSGKLYVAIEAGALVRSTDRGDGWSDRVSGGPIDTHTAASHREAEGRVYSAAGDGYFETTDGGETWARISDGLRHGYMVGVAVDPGDPDTVVVSGASGPYVSYHPRNAEAYLYRKTTGARFELAMDGLPDAVGTVANLLSTHPDEPGRFYAANNFGLFKSTDAGQSWREIEADWPEGAFRSGVQGFAVFEN